MKINYIFTILWILAILLFVVIGSLITLPYIDISNCETLNNIVKKTNIKDLTTLLVPLGVLISASLASTSVMKSIHNTNKIENAKNEEKIVNADKYFTLILGNMKASFLAFELIDNNSIILKNAKLVNLEEEDLSDEIEGEIILQAQSMPLLLKNPIEEFKLHLEKLLQKLETKDLIYYSTNTNIIDKVSKLISKILIDIDMNLKLFYLSEKMGNKLELSSSTFNINKFVFFCENTKKSIIEINTYIEDDNLKIKYN